MVSKQKVLFDNGLKYMLFSHNKKENKKVEEVTMIGLMNKEINQEAREKTENGQVVAQIEGPYSTYGNYNRKILI